MKKLIAALILGMTLCGCATNATKMPVQEIDQDWRFYKVKIKKDQIVAVTMLAEHKQDFSWLKTNDDYTVISLDKFMRLKPGSAGRFGGGIYEQAVKVYIQPQQSFLLNWSYLTDKGERTALYTKVEVE